MATRSIIILTDLGNLKIFLRATRPQDTTQDGILTQMIPVASRVCELFTHRKLENGVYVEYPNITGQPDLPLKQRPVQMILATGTIVSGSPVVTALSTTDGVVPGMPCVVTASYGVLTSPFPNATNVLSVDSTSQVTLSGNATASATAAPLAFGLDCWIDPLGYGGQGRGSSTGGPYGAGTNLRLGLDYMLQTDQSDSSFSKSGMLRLLRGWSGAASAGFWGWGDALMGPGYGRGTLTAVALPIWPTLAPRSIKCVYSAGLGVGAPPGGSLPLTGAVPAELTHAANCLVSFMRAAAPVGVAVDLDGVGQQSLLLLSNPTKGESPDIGTARQLLSSYREQSL